MVSDKERHESEPMYRTKASTSDMDVELDAHDTDNLVRNCV